MTTETVTIERSKLKLALEALESSQQYVEACANAKTKAGWGEQLDVAEDAITAIKEALAQPEQEPFGYFKPEPFGWTDCAETDEGAIALYEKPQPKETEQRPISDVTEAVTRTVIQVEKLLCGKLGKQWQAGGMSISTLVDELALRTTPPQRKPLDIKTIKRIATYCGEHITDEDVIEITRRVEEEHKIKE